MIKKWIVFESVFVVFLLMMPAFSAQHGSEYSLLSEDMLKSTCLTPDHKENMDYILSKLKESNITQLLTNELVTHHYLQNMISRYSNTGSLVSISDDSLDLVHNLGPGIVFYFGLGQRILFDSADLSLPVNVVDGLFGFFYLFHFPFDLDMFVSPEEYKITGYLCVADVSIASIDLLRLYPFIPVFQSYGVFSLSNTLVGIKILEEPIDDSF